MQITLKQAAQITGAEPKGDENLILRELCALDEAKADGVCYLTSLEKTDLLAELKTACLIVPQEAKNKNLPFKGALLYAKNPEWAFILLLKYVDGLTLKHTPGIHPSAVISASARLGKDVSVGAYSVIEEGVVIGDNTVIFPQVYIGKNTHIGTDCYIYPQVVIREECILKDHVILQPGAKIGNDGFGFSFHEGRHQKIPQIGNVIIESDVEIQANACVDRAKISSTLIGANTKIDNLVQIAHNVKIGQSTIMCAQVGVAGTTTIGSGVILAGQVGVIGHLHVGDRAQVGAQSGVINSIPAGASYFGYPAGPMKETLKKLAIENKLPEIYKEFKELKKRLAQANQLSFFAKLKKRLGL